MSISQYFTELTEASQTELKAVLAATEQQGWLITQISSAAETLLTCLQQFRKDLAQQIARIGHKLDCIEASVRECEERAAVRDQEQQKAMELLDF